MDPILSAEELDKIRDVGVSMMTTPIKILRSSVITVSSAEYDAAYDYGDDAVVDPDVVEQADEVETVYGWFVSRPLQTEFDADIDISTQSIHVVRLPVGTDVRPKDFLQPVASPELAYLVIDVNEDDTWPEWLKAMVRRSE